MRNAPWFVLKMVMPSLWMLVLSSGALAEAGDVTDESLQAQGEPEAIAPEAPAEVSEAAEAAPKPEAKVEPAVKAEADKAGVVEGAAAAAGAAVPTEAAVNAAPSPGAASSGSINGESSGKPDRIAAGERVTVREGDFSLIPPHGWEVYEHLTDLTLLMQMPHQDGVKYQRTIQVASFAKPRFIDETTAKEYEEVITRKFAATSVAIEGYRIRNHMVIDMADGRQGLLFYTEFTLDSVALMQAHILVSSADRHYLMTYTDIAEHFESEAANQFLTEAWDSMISVQLGSATPGRFAAITYGGVGLALAVVLTATFIWWRSRRAARQYRDYADGDSDGAVDPSLPATRMSHLGSSAVSSFATGVPTSEEPSRMSTLASKQSEGFTKPGKKMKAKQHHTDDHPVSISSRPAKKTSKKPETLYSEGDEPLGLDDDEAV